MTKLRGRPIAGPGRDRQLFQCEGHWIEHGSGPWFSIKMSSYQHRKSHCGDKTIIRLVVHWTIKNKQDLNNIPISFKKTYIDGLVQDCSISSALAMEILQSCTKPSILSIQWGFLWWQDSIFILNQTSGASDSTQIPWTSDWTGK